MPFMKKPLLLLTLAASLSATSLFAADTARLDELLHDSFTYRNLGPFRAGSWVSDVAVPENPLKAHLYTIYVAPRNGGIWKTTNNGVTFQSMFDQQPQGSMGAVAVAPSDENQVWAGTGDASCTRSATRGDGIYKSTDGGRTWQNMGLKDSQHIARIIVHPTNPEIVWVAATGHLFSTNEERGVFKTTDGGKSWKKVLYLNERTMAIDLVLNRKDVNTLYAAMYDCVRRPWTLEDGGPGSGIHKTADGGNTWKKLEDGLPTGTIGRIGIDLYAKNPEIIYAIVDNRNRVTNTAASDVTPGRGRGGGAGALVGGELYRSEDGGNSWHKMNNARDDLSRKSGYAFNQIRVDTGNPDRVFITGSSMASSSDGGKTWAGLGGGGEASPFRRAFGDFRSLWIDRENPERMIATSDGGVFLSYDGGRTCDHLANLALGEVYALTVDMESPYNIYCGLQDHESWKGPSDGWSGSVGIENWSTVGIGDGMYNQVDPTDSRWVYNTQEFGKLGRYDQKTRTRVIVGPTQSPDESRLRYNWVAPFRISPHDPKTLYAGAQFLYRTRDRGDSWEAISPDLTYNDPKRISPPGAAIQFCTITTISESPAQAGVIWVGTDDGKAQVTRDGGKTWTDATPALLKAGALEDAWVTRVCASPTKPGTAYVSKSRHRQDDFRPFLYKTTDFGATWTSISASLPERPINVVFEDYKNPNLVFVGNDEGVFASVDGGAHWSALRGNMPPAPVHDLLVHPRDGDLVAGTYGRGIWITDITPLREMNLKMLDDDAFFFTIQPGIPRRDGALGNYRLYGDRQLTTPNGPNGTVFQYYHKEGSPDSASITIADANGTVLRTVTGTTRAGINRVPLSARGGFGGGGGGGRRGGGAAVREIPPGEYTVTLKIGDKSFTQKAHIASALPEETAGQGEDDL
jgi:photosystem II stability/assembly factor-like uncharacterized protein